MSSSDARSSVRYDFSVSAVDTFQFFGDTFRNGLLLDEFRFKRQSDDWIVFLIV